MTVDEIIKDITLILVSILGSSAVVTALTLWFNRRKNSAETNEIQTKTKTDAKKGDVDYVDKLLEASDKLDKRREGYVEDLRNELVKEKVSREQLSKRIGQLEEKVKQLSLLLTEASKALQYVAFFNVIDFPAFVIDQDTQRILNMNLKALELFGYTKEDVSKLGIRSIIVDPRQLKQELLDHTILIGEHEYIKHDFSKFTANASVAYYSDGEIATCLIIFTCKPPPPPECSAIAR